MPMTGIMNSPQPANSLKFQEAMTLANDLDTDIELKVDYGYNIYFGYRDNANNEHQVWLLNGPDSVESVFI